MGSGADGSGWRPGSLPAAGALAGPVFMLVKTWYQVADRWEFDLTGVDADPGSFEDRGAIAAVCLRKLQLLHFLALRATVFPDPWMVMAHLTELQVGLTQVLADQAGLAAADSAAVGELEGLVRRLCLEIAEHFN